MFVVFLHAKDRGFLPALMNRPYHTLTVEDCYGDMFPSGTVLWRATHQFSNSAEIRKVLFDQTDQGTFLCRMHFLGVSAGWEPHVYGAREFDGRTKGLVVFLEEEPCDNWTHLIVIGVSRKMQYPIGSERGAGVCIFAKPAQPYDMDDYLNFRSRLARKRRQRPNATIEEIVDLSNECWPEGKRDWERRLVVDKNWMRGQTPMPLYDYAHLNSH